MTIIGPVVFAIVVFCLIVAPISSYLFDGLRYVWYRLKGVGK